MKKYILQTVLLFFCCLSECDLVAKTTGIWYEPWYTNYGHYVWIRDHGVDSQGQLLGDVNGDGKADAGTFSNANGDWYVALSNGNGFDANSLWKTNFGQNSTRQFLADVDGDGKADSAVFYVSSGQWYVALSNGNSFGGYSLWKDAFGNNSTKQFLADVNGDGKKDAVVYYDGSGQWYVACSTGTSFGAYSLWKDAFGSGSTNQLLGDVKNWDGKADAIVFYDGVGQGVWYVAPSTGSNFGGYAQWASGVGSGSTAQFCADVSDDDVADILIYYADGPITPGNWYFMLSSGGAFGDCYEWKRCHGNGSRLLQDYSSWQGVADVKGDGNACPVVYYSLEGMWKVMPADLTNYLSPDTYNFWDSEDIRYVPWTLGTYRQYDSGDPNVIDEHISMFSDAEIDFVVLDMTNYINCFYKDRAKAFTQRLAAWNNSHSTGKVYYAVAVGYAGLTQDPADFEYEAGVVWNEFVNDANCPSSNYLNRDGKPLIIAFGTRQLWESWGGDKTNSNHFTVHFAEGQVDAQLGKAFLSNGTWWTIPSVDYGKYYGWSYITGSLSNANTMVVMPGWNFMGYPIDVSRSYGGVYGDFYKLACWDRVVLQQPDMVVINSFNEFSEQTALQPADSTNLGNVGAEIWYNKNGVADPNFYWDMTVDENGNYKYGIFVDGFESNFDKWTDGGATDWDRGTDQKGSGTYAARCGGSDTNLTSDDINAAGKTSMTITFWYRDHLIDDDDEVYLQFYNGTSYVNKFELGNISPEDEWHKYQVTLDNSGVDTQYFRSNFRLRFAGTGIDLNEYLWIDDVSVTAQ